MKRKVRQMGVTMKVPEVVRSSGFRRLAGVLVCLLVPLPFVLIGFAVATGNVIFIKVLLGIYGPICVIGFIKDVRRVLRSKRER